MRAGEIQRFQPGADYVVAELLHTYRGPVGSGSEASRKPLKKQLAGWLTGDRTIPWYFEFDSLARVCFLWFQTPQDVECTDFSGGAANGGRV
jgi:hypothetical protein